MITIQKQNKNITKRNHINSSWGYVVKKTERKLMIECFISMDGIDGEWESRGRIACDSKHKVL